MKSKTLFFLFLIAYSLLVIPPAFAGCTNSYGSSVECPPNRLEINKKVRYPTNVNLFVENLTSNDAKYAPGDTVEYEIAVTNSSNVDYTQVTVTDALPTGLTFVGGPGAYNSANRTLTYTLHNLKAGETVRTRFTATVKDASAFGNAEITCQGDRVVNYVKVTGPDNQTDDDTATLCVQTKVLGVTTLPVAGFEDWVWILPFAIMGVLGLILMMAQRRTAP